MFQPYIPEIDFPRCAPFIALLAGAILCLIGDAMSNKEGSRKLLPPIVFVSLTLSLLGFMQPMWDGQPYFFENFLRGSQFAVLGSLTIIFSALVMAALGPETVRRRNLPAGEYYTLILFATFGMTLLAFAQELLTAFICIEILSLSLYVLTAMDRRSERAIEAGFKYFILGAFASAFFVMGVAFLYGAAGTTHLLTIAEVLQSGHRTIAPGVTEPLNSVWLLLGFALMFVGLCFKLSLAPFHMWAPDVYEGAPTTTAMIIATGSKVGAFAFLYHLLTALSMWTPFMHAAAFIMGFVAIASMVWGNVAALVQSNVKRMLAYSSIAHGGYLMVGYAALMGLNPMDPANELFDMRRDISGSLLLYLFGYTLLNVLAFGLVHYLGRGGESEMGNYRGLWKRKPLAATGMALAMFGLTGVPPTVGFIGKFYVFRHAIEQGMYTLAVVGVLMSVVSAFYYLRLVVTMFMTEAEGEAPAGGFAGGDGAAVMAGGRGGVLLLAALLVFLVGVFPMAFLALSGG